MGTFFLYDSPQSIRDHKHVTLKIGTRKALERKLRVLRHFATIRTNHAGSQIIRQMFDDFAINGKHGLFHGVVYPPLAISVKTFRGMLPKRALPIGLLKLVLNHVFLSLDFLHTEAKVIHTGKAAVIQEENSRLIRPLFTDIQESNILLGMNEETAKQDLEKFEEQELNSPCARKIDGERIIYTSRPLAPSLYPYGRPILSDFGEARFGEYDNMADIQPYQYRAPEVIFDIPWDEKVDIWNVGVMVRAKLVLDEDQMQVG